MDGLFISYRRQDASGHAGRLRDHLRARFGQRVFQDVDDIPDGELFEEVLDRALASCRVGLVVIGPRWLDALDTAGRRRLDAPDDWVRVEIRHLLERGIRVIPVLVGGARFPDAESLPEDLRPLAKRQVRELRDASWDADMAALIKRLEEALGLRQPRRMVWIASAATLVLAASVIAWSPWSHTGRGEVLVQDAASQAARPSDMASAPLEADATIAAATALGLPGTHWTIEDFSGIEPESPTPKDFEFVQRGGAMLLQSGGKTAQDSMLVKQIHGRAITLLPQAPDGKPFEYMYVFELANDGSTLDQCRTVQAGDLAAQGPCQWRYHRAVAAKPSDTTAATRLKTPVTCGKGMPSDADPACVSAAQAASLLGTWTGTDGKTSYALEVADGVVQLKSPALRDEKPWRLLLRSVHDGTVSLAWAGMNNRPEAFDGQMWVEYDLVIVGGSKRLVKCRSITQLSARQDVEACSDVPAFLVQRGV